MRSLESALQKFAQQKPRTLNDKRVRATVIHLHEKKEVIRLSSATKS